MMWYALVEVATSKLVSVGTVLPDPIPAKFKAIELGEDFDQSTGRIWDEATETFVEDEAPGVLADMVLDFPAISKLDVAEKAELKRRVVAIIKGIPWL